MNPVCPYCRMEIDAADKGQVECPACHTLHHRDCFTENGGCTIFGCTQAPADEPKISLTGSDLRASRPVMPVRPNFPAVAPMPAVALAAAPASVSLPSAPPPPNSRDTTSVAPPPSPNRGIAPPPRPFGATTSSAPRLTPAEVYAGVDAHKNRVAFVLFGLFLGFFGAHSFYAGYYRRGAAQAALTVFSWWLFSRGYGTLIAWVWAVVEICIITKDADGVQFS